MSLSGRHSQAPGPAGDPVLGNLRAFRRDPLRLAEEAVAAHGDLIRFRLGPHVVHLLNHPDFAAHVLQKRRDNYDKNTRSSSRIRRICGESLLTANGDLWRRRRDLLQPAFHHDKVRLFADEMARLCGETLDAWERSPAPRDLFADMTRLTFRVVSQSLFSTDPGPRPGRIETAMRVLLEDTFTALQRLCSAPRWLPNRGNRRFAAALAEVDSVVYRIIAEHRAKPARADLLGTLLGMRDPQSGAGLTDEELRNETITFLIAGHETTAAALSWTFHLLALHPEIQETLRRQVRKSLGDRPPALADLASMPLLLPAIREGLRLYPPIWILERRARREDQIGGCRIPAGSSVVLCPWTLHRHPGFWEDPLAFRPQRFDGSPTPAYLPFGAGPRFCIGSEFALLEAQIITAMIVQRFHLAPAPGIRIEPFPGITLPPRGGLPLRVEPLP